MGVHDATIEHDGATVPKVGLGTWRAAEETCYRAVRTALEVGYRHVDTAQLYGNEREVGRALADAPVPREDVFLTTKVDPTNRSYADIVTSVRESVSELGVESLDLLLIHWPHPLADLETTMAGLNAAVNEGLTDHIGVSNFGVERLERARELSAAPVFTNQVQFHPFYPQRELLSYCQREDVLLTAYSPLAHGGALRDPLLAELGEQYGKSPAQIALRWATQHENVITIPKSTSEAHLRANLDVFDFALTRAEHDRVTRPSKLKTGLSFARGRLGL
jgi:diketogulonate reductase-like aldo/keto reductase